MTALAVAGWLMAAAALALGLRVRRELAHRRELVARAAHELRGPLFAASLALNAARHDAEAPARRVAAVELELRRAALALDDLFAAGGGEPPEEPDELVEVGDLLARQVVAWSEVARAHGCELRLADHAPEAVVFGNRLRLAQATGNLIANAVEHGRGTIELTVRSAGAAVRVEVADEGPGLPAPVAELARRPRAGRGRRGRGLAIATEIAARHGGRLAAGPAARGARVALELPAVETPVQGAAS